MEAVCVCVCVCTLEQYSHTLDVSLDRCLVEGCLQPEIHAVGIGPVVQQQLHASDVVVGRCFRQRSLLPARTRFKVRSRSRRVWLRAVVLGGQARAHHLFLVSISAPAASSSWRHSLCPLRAARASGVLCSDSLELISMPSALSRASTQPACPSYDACSRP